MTLDLVTRQRPKADQPQAIAKLVTGLRDGRKYQVLQGVTGSGKTLTMGNVIHQVQRPTLVITHNKTLAEQLFGEFRELFPKAVTEYFVSDYLYYRPESCDVEHDSHTKKRAALDLRLTQHRLAATTALLRGRRDVIVVCSTSCLFDLGSPDHCRQQILTLPRGDVMPRESLLARLALLGYEECGISLTPGTFRAIEANVEVFPPYETVAYRLEFRRRKLVRVTPFHPASGRERRGLDQLTLCPARYFILPEGQVQAGIPAIERELKEQLREFRRRGKWRYMERLSRQAGEDLTALRLCGCCPGIENYSRHLSGRSPGSPPATLLDYFPEDLLVFVDESHATIPQIEAMQKASRQRKLKLVRHGFRLPSTLDDRPLRLREWEGKAGQVIFVSATPGDYELEKAHGEVVEQVLRPTGLLDPIVEIQPKADQQAHLLRQIRKRVKAKERVLVVDVEKRSAVALASRLSTEGVRCKWLHGEVTTAERSAMLRGLRRGDFDVLVSVNLLREGLDLPEVSLVAILDADREGFLRSETSLTQIAGRGARNVNASVILYANTVTESMAKMVCEARRRRALQEAYNKSHGIRPRSIRKPIRKGILDETTFSDGRNETGGRRRRSPNRRRKEPGRKGRRSRGG